MVKHVNNRQVARHYRYQIQAIAGTEVLEQLLSVVVRCAADIGSKKRIFCPRWLLRPLGKLFL